MLAQQKVDKFLTKHFIYFPMKCTTLYLFWLGVIFFYNFFKFLDLPFSLGHYHSTVYLKEKKYNFFLNFDNKLHSHDPNT